MLRLACLVVGYFIGCIQAAYFVGKFYKVDIRKKGSGNLGSTNTLRVLGLKAAGVTFLIDVMKAVVAFLICQKLFGQLNIETMSDSLAGVYGCAGVILGHDFPFFLKFKGGKGIAATIGLVLMLVFHQGYYLLLISAVLSLGILVFKYISLGSITFVITIAIISYFMGIGTEASVVITLLSLLALYQHRANIQRLLSGTENKFIK